MSTELVWYVGKRWNGTKTVHSALYPDGHVYNFPKAKDKNFIGALIGRQYEINDGILPVLWQAANFDLHEKTKEWQTAHRVALEQAKAKRGEISPELAAIVSDLKIEVWKLSTAQRSMFLGWLINQFMKWR